MCLWGTYRTVGIQLEISRFGREGLLNGTMGAVKETYEISHSGREGLLKRERVSCCTSKGCETSWKGSQGKCK